MSENDIDFASSDEELTKVQEVRYSLPKLLHELQVERTSSVFSKEILDQVEISKIFAQKKRAREKARE
ncbi:MAG: hypothetical protein DRP71_04475 [Verrucomicrobia bacterium]|nr:MAG: hypothetical protein DRP71_04475 [Verrucomicrobiota bacterium]